MMRKTVEGPVGDQVIWAQLHIDDCPTAQIRDARVELSTIAPIIDAAMDGRVSVEQLKTALQMWATPLQIALSALTVVIEAREAGT